MAMVASDTLQEPLAGPAARGGAFSISEARAIVQHLFRRNPALYWLDLALTMTIVYTAGWCYLGPGWTGWRIAAGFVCGFAIFRMGSFVHELAHLRHGELLRFHIAWNVVYGVPFLLPSFLYTNHRDHHNARTYGTEEDLEYTVFVTGPVGQVVGHFVAPLIAPLALIARFLVLTPVSLVIYPASRRFVLEYATSLGQAGRKRKLWPDEAHATWAMIELACFAVALAEVMLFVLGILPAALLLKLYPLMAFSVTLNAMRDFTAHRFRPSAGRRPFAAQLEDSINITGKSLLSYLTYPIGLRYHALHHLFPTMPYHNLGRAHRLLMARLPVDSPYRSIGEQGFFPAAGHLIGEVLAARKITAPAE